MKWLGRKNREAESAVDKINEISNNLKVISDDLDLVVGDLQKEVRIREQRRPQQSFSTRDNRANGNFI